MYRSQVLAFVFLSVTLAAACGDDDPGTEQGQGGTSNAGAAGTDSTAAGTSSGGSSGGSSGAGGSSSSGASGMAGSGSGNPVVQDVCQRGCAKTDPLNCPADPADCVAQCLADYQDFPEECRELVLAFGNCGADRPAGDFLCGDDGRATLRDGICEAEGLAALSCVFGGL